MKWIRDVIQLHAQSSSFFPLHRRCSHPHPDDDGETAAVAAAVTVSKCWKHNVKRERGEKRKEKNCHRRENLILWLNERQQVLLLVLLFSSLIDNVRVIRFDEGTFKYDAAQPLFYYERRIFFFFFTRRSPSRKNTLTHTDGSEILKASWSSFCPPSPYTHYYCHYYDYWMHCGVCVLAANADEKEKKKKTKTNSRPFRDISA